MGHMTAKRRNNVRKLAEERNTGFCRRFYGDPKEECCWSVGIGLTVRSTTRRKMAHKTRKSWRTAFASSPSLPNGLEKIFEEVQAHCHRRDERRAVTVRPARQPILRRAIANTNITQLHQDRRLTFRVKEILDARVQGQVIRRATTSAPRRRVQASWHCARNVKHLDEVVPQGVG